MDELENHKEIQNVAWSIKNIADSVEAKIMPNLVPGSKINFLSFLEGFIKTHEQNPPHLPNF